MRITHHAVSRLRQRGKSESDLELVVRHGTEVRDGFFLRDCDAAAAIRQRKQEISRLEHLKGLYVVINPERTSLITSYHPHKTKKRRLMRADT